MRDRAKVAEECRELLSQQQITVSSPGSILRDVQAMLDFIGTDGLESKSQQGNLPPAALPELNRRLSQPIELSLNRALLRDYPNLAGVYILLRVMDLVRAGEGRVYVCEETRQRWAGLNPTEQYFALLEAWLIHAEENVLGGSRSRFQEQFWRNFAFLDGEAAARWKPHEKLGLFRCFWGEGIAWNTQLQARFGLIEIAPLPQADRTRTMRGWMLGRARRTPWGKAVAWAIGEFLRTLPDVPEDLYYFHLPESAGFGFLQPAFQPYFPEWQRVFTEAIPEVRPGLYVFKVNLDPRYYGKGTWRRLAVPHTCDLEDVALAVLEAYEFDDDHLWEFRFRDQLGKARVYNHYYCDEGPYTHEITVGKMALPEGQTMKFRFDFGDCWDFLLRLERIEPRDPKVRQPKVIEAVGEPPEQYPNYDEQ